MKKKPSKQKEYRVLDEMNNHNAIKLLSPSANRVFQVVQYEDEELQKVLAKLPAGKLIELKLEPINVRANVWEATRPESVDTLVA